MTTNSPLRTPFHYGQLQRCARAFQYSIRREKRTLPISTLKGEYFQYRTMITDFLSNRRATQVIGNLHINASSTKIHTLRPGYYAGLRIRTQQGLVRVPLLENKSGNLTVYFFHLGIIGQGAKASTTVGRTEFSAFVVSREYPNVQFSLVSLGETYNEDKSLAISDITDKLSWIAGNKIPEMHQRAMTLLNQAQLIDLGFDGRCGLGTRYACPYASTCLDLCSESNLLRHKGFSKKNKYTLLRAGIKEVDKVPYSLRLSKTESLILQQNRDSTDHINRDEIAKWLVNFDLKLTETSRPFLFMDFEAAKFRYHPNGMVNSKYDLPFQFSVHALDSGRFVHAGEFLKYTGKEITRDFAVNLLETVEPFLAKGAKVLAYGKSFEIRILKEISQQLPEFGMRLAPLIGSVVDLMQPFKSLHFYSPRQFGGYSLKTVYPVMLDYLSDSDKQNAISYGELNIRDGLSAVAIFFRIQELSHRESLRPTEAKLLVSLRESLLAYCRLDTSSMYYILRGLNNIVSESFEPR